ncbi:MAG: NUDIX hydrolase [Burkholderiaceae bacterium]
MQPEMAFWKPSVTVAAVIEHHGKFLLVEEDTADGVRLNQPAGHLDPHESLIDAAIRETREETMRDFTPTAWLGAYMSRYTSARNGEDVTYVRFAFSGSASEEVAGRTLDKEIRRTLWMSADELRAVPDQHRSPLVMRCVDDYLASVRLPLSALYTHDSIFRSPLAEEGRVRGAFV